MFFRMVEEILKTRLMVKKAMKDYKGDKVGVDKIGVKKNTCIFSSLYSFT